MAKSPRKYERASGAGLEIEILFRNRLLIQTYDYTFERTDNQLQALSAWKGAGQDVDQVRALFEEQITSLDGAISQLQELAEQTKVKPAFTGKGFPVTAIALTPHAARYLEILNRIDTAISWLHALWISGQIGDETFREQASKLRGKAHKGSAAVGELFRRHVLGQGAEASEGDAKGQEAADSSPDPLAALEAEDEAEIEARAANDADDMEIEVVERAAVALN